MSVGSEAILQPRGNTEIQALVDAHPLAWIICASPSAFTVTPVPVHLHCDDDGHPNAGGSLRRWQPAIGTTDRHARRPGIADGARVLCVTFLARRSHASTWNCACAVVHVHVALEDAPACVAQRLDDLVTAMESPHAQPWSSSEMGARYTSLSRGVVGFDAPIHAVRTTLKVGQDERDDVFADILAGLDARGEHNLARIERFAGPGRLDRVAVGRDASRAPSRVAGRVPAHDRSLLDPQIEHFVRAVTDDNHRLSVGHTLDWRQRRIIAEQCRTPWAQGGPRIPLVRDFELPPEIGPARVRLYDPSPASVKPVLAHIHGGGWSMFSLDAHDRLTREYAPHRARVAVFGVDYPLASEYMYPHALHQVVEALHWLLAEADTLGIDDQRIVLGGISAGANLALATAPVQRDAGKGCTIGGLLLNYGAFDASVDSESLRRFGADPDMLSFAEVDMFWSNYLRDDVDRLDPLACPLRADPTGLPPSLLIVPECDVLAGQSVAIVERMREAGIDLQCKVYSGAVHSFLEAMSTSTVADHAIEDTATWMRRRLHDEGTPAIRCDARRDNEGYP